MIADFLSESDDLLESDSIGKPRSSNTPRLSDCNLALIVNLVVGEIFNEHRRDLSRLARTCFALLLTM